MEGCTGAVAVPVSLLVAVSRLVTVIESLANLLLNFSEVADVSCGFESIHQECLVHAALFAFIRAWSVVLANA